MSTPLSRVPKINQGTITFQEPMSVLDFLTEHGGGVASRSAAASPEKAALGSLYPAGMKDFTQSYRLRPLLQFFLHYIL